MPALVHQSTIQVQPQRRTVAPSVCQSWKTWISAVCSTIRSHEWMKVGWKAWDEKLSRANTKACRLPDHYLKEKSVRTVIKLTAVVSCPISFMFCICCFDSFNFWSALRFKYWVLMLFSSNWNAQQGSVRKVEVNERLDKSQLTLVMSLYVTLVYWWEATVLFLLVMRFSRSSTRTRTRVIGSNDFSTKQTNKLLGLWFLFVLVFQLDVNRSHFSVLKF